MSGREGGRRGSGEIIRLKYLQFILPSLRFEPQKPLEKLLVFKSRLVMGPVDCKVKSP